MITDKQKEWIEGFVSGVDTKRTNPHKYSVYNKRIRERIDSMFENLLWLAMNSPEYLTDEEFEIQEYGSITHRRLKMLFQTIKCIQPNADPVLVRIREEITSF